MSSTQQRLGIESLDVVTLVVDDQDEARSFYAETLGFEVRADEEFETDGATGRWLTVGVPGQDVQIALVESDAPYYDDETEALLSGKLGTETWWTFRTVDCEESVAALEAAGVEVTEPPETRAWGTEATFADPFGNEFGLFEPAG